MKTPHEHADVIKAWADGAEIEFWCVPADEWRTASSPQWNHGDSYRIKPEPWEKFCDSNCVLTDHHPDCKLAQPQQGEHMTELKRFEQWWDAEDDIPNNGPYTPDTPIQFAWAGWQAALAQQEQQRMAKRIEDLEAMLERQTARIADLQTHIENFDGEDR